jgi:2-oxoglutarate ferredoxin oxidoreductase subunit delta
MADAASTVSGPAQGAQPRARLPRGCVTVFPNWCKGCDLCVEFCPGQVLQHGAKGRVIVAHPERCRGCRWCELHCPDFAIFVTVLDSPETPCPAD